MRMPSLLFLATSYWFFGGGAATAPGCAGVVGGGFAPGALFAPMAVPLNTNSTRRFIFRPAAVVFGAIGFSCPMPFAVTLSVGTPWLIRKSRTDAARFSERAWFHCGVPVLSV